MRRFPLLILLVLSLSGTVTYGKSAQASAESHLKIGLARYEKGELQEAIVEYNAAIEINPQFTKAYNARGLARERTGDYDSAIADYTQAIKIDPNYVVAYSNRGLARAGKGDHDGAVADFNKAIEVNPQSAYAYYVRGHARKVYYDHLDEAIADFNKAIEINPSYALAYYQRGLARYAKGDYDGAVADSTRVIEFDRPPGWLSIGADAYALRGSAKLQQGKDAEAQHDFDSAIKLDSRWKSRLEAESTKIKQYRKPKE